MLISVCAAVLLATGYNRIVVAHPPSIVLAIVFIDVFINEFVVVVVDRFSLIQNRKRQCVGGSQTEAGRVRPGQEAAGGRPERRDVAPPVGAAAPDVAGSIIATSS